MLGALTTIASARLSPTFESHQEAAKAFPGLKVDEYALARVVASEFASGTPTEMACIADSIRNRAGDQQRSILAFVTGGTGEFGGQGGVRKQSSARAPGPRHVQVAIAVLRSPTILPFVPPALAGVSRGARLFFDPKTQAFLNARDGSSRACPPLAILESWTFSKRIVSRNGNGCQLAEQRGGGQVEWVGPIPGVDAYQLMLFRPAGPGQESRYREARKVIESKGKYQGSALPIAPLDVAMVACLVGATYLAAHGVI